MNRDEYPEEVSVLTIEMQQRVETARQARALLEKRSRPQGGIFGVPVIEPADVMDLINLAQWLLTGVPWVDVKEAVAPSNVFLTRFREEQVDFPHSASCEAEQYLPDPAHPQACIDPACELNWRQPDPITPAERERMSVTEVLASPEVQEALNSIRVGGPIDPTFKGAPVDIEKDDVPIPSILTAEGARHHPPLSDDPSDQLSTDGRADW